MRPLTLLRRPARLLGVLAAGAAVAATPRLTADEVRAVLPERHRARLAEHCGGCHGPEKQKGNFRLDELPFTLGDLPTAERWQRVLNALNSGEMPPEGEPPLPAEVKTDLLDDLARTMVTARRALADQHGYIALRRLNRREYRHTLRDLLGVELDVSELPSDTGGRHFDTVGAALYLTGHQFEQYESLAREALADAFDQYRDRTASRRLRLEAERLNPLAARRHREARERIDQGRAWMRAVDEAAAAPANAALVADLRRIAPTDDLLRYHWRKIAGAPSPVRFGFEPVAEVNAATVYRLLENTAFIRYDDYHDTLPHRDTGAYLTLPLGYGGSSVTSVQSLPLPNDFPPGDYVVRVRVGARPGTPESRRFLEFGLKGTAGSTTPAISTHHVTASIQDPQVIEIPFTFLRKNAARGHRQLFFRERGAATNEYWKRLLREGQERNGFGAEAALWLDWYEIERRPAGPLAPGLAALAPLLDAPEPSDRELRHALGDFATLAFRGTPPGDGQLDGLVRLYRSTRDLGATAQEGLRTAIASVLSAPAFLYRAEPGPAPDRRLLTGRELAVRLAYFLTGAPPDGDLRTAAETGELLTDQALAAQAARLLASPRSRDFVESFISQWLSLDRLDLFQFSPRLYPRFDASLKAAARQEVLETFARLLRQNAPLTELLRSDQVVVNALLADYYGLPAVAGDEFRPVPVPAGSPRGGLLGMAAILAMGSNGERTNPVERGAWVLRKLLDEPPPPAPANVPELARLSARPLTTRERLQAHQEQPQCASCHRKIDPIGFGLENFDAAGQWRTTDTYEAHDAAGRGPGTRTWTIDPAGTLHRGPSFQSFPELRDLIAARGDAFARGFASALIEYALGRPTGFTDEPLVGDLVRQGRADHFGVRSFVLALIRSPQFRSR